MTSLALLMYQTPIRDDSRRVRMMRKFHAIADGGEATCRAIVAGFAGVELHGAMYAMQQLLPQSTPTNALMNGVVI